MTDVRHTHSFIHVFEISRCFHVGLQVEPEDVAVRELWSVVPRGLHTVSNQAITVWRQVRYWALLQKALCVQNYRFVITIKGFIWLGFGAAASMFKCAQLSLSRSSKTMFGRAKLFLKQISISDKLNKCVLIIDIFWHRSQTSSIAT